MLNANILLRGQPVNVLRALDEGNTVAARQGDQAYQTAQRMFLAENGAGIMSGDRNALRGLARFDPSQAQSIDLRNRADQRASAAAARSAQAAAQAQKLAAEQAQGREMFGKAILGLQSGDASGWNMLTAELGLAPGSLEPTEQNLGLVWGQLTQDPAQMLAAMQGPEEPAYRVVTGEEAQGMGLDPSRSYNVGVDGKVTAIGAAPQNTAVFDSDGNLVFSQGTADPSQMKLTVEQGKNAGFLVRLRDSNRILDELEAEGTSIGGRIRENVPFGAGNFFQTPDYQRFEQARRDFVNAVLRRESGAVISPDEFANAERQYFPVPGDSPAVIEQKRKNRVNAVLGIEIGAGPGANVTQSSTFGGQIPPAPQGISDDVWPLLYEQMSEEDRRKFQ